MREHHRFSTSPRPAARRLAALLAATLLPALALAAPPAPPARSLPVGQGDTVSVDLSRVPARIERRGSAACVGARITLVGTREELKCAQPFTFDAPLQGDPVVLIFEPKGGGKPTRLEYPLERDPRPRRFVAPAAGTISQPAAPPAGAAKDGAAKDAMPADVLAKARAAATEACDRCPPGSPYALRDFTVEQGSTAALEVSVTVTPAAGAGSPQPPPR
jgi:hypothetical protein